MELKQLALETPGRVEKLMDELLFSNALQEIWKLVSRSNKYIDETTPWLLAKSESDGPRLGTVLYNLAESLRFISVLISPFMTRTPPRIQEQLGISSSGDSTWESLKEFGRLKAGSRVKRGEVIFPRLDPEKELEALEALRQEKLQEETVRAAADKAERKIQILAGTGHPA